MRKATPTIRTQPFEFQPAPGTDWMTGAAKAARRIAALALLALVLPGATPYASSAEGAGSSPLTPKVPVGAHGVELVVGDAAVDRIDALFLEYDPAYPENFAVRERRFDALAERLFARAARGQDNRCSRQIFLEAKWLLGYTAWWPRLDARLDDLEVSFAMVDQSFAAAPSPADGFYGRCATQMFIRMEDTLVNYFEMAGRGEVPTVERKPLEVLRDAKKMTAFFEAHLISDIPETGEDSRSRLGVL